MTDRGNRVSLASWSAVALLLLGAALVALGAGLMLPAAGFIVGGVELLIGGTVVARLETLRVQQGGA